MDNFKLPITPSHVATAAGVAILQIDPGLSAETRALCTFGILAVYVVGESIYSSVKVKKLAIPLEALKELKERIAGLERRK